MSQKLKLMSLTELLDILAELTKYYICLCVRGGVAEQFNKSREILEQVQQEIKLRKTERNSVQTIK